MPTFLSANHSKFYSASFLKIQPRSTNYHLQPVWQLKSIYIILCWKSKFTYIQQVDM